MALGCTAGRAVCRKETGVELSLSPGRRWAQRQGTDDSPLLSCRTVEGHHTAHDSPTRCRV